MDIGAVTWCYSSSAYLIQGMRQVADAIDVAPVKRGWQISGLQVLMRQRRGKVIVDGVRSDLPAKKKRHASEFGRAKDGRDRDEPLEAMKHSVLAYLDLTEVLCRGALPQ